MTKTARKTSVFSMRLSETERLQLATISTITNKDAADILREALQRAFEEVRGVQYRSICAALVSGFEDGLHYFALVHCPEGEEQEVVDVVELKHSAKIVERIGDVSRHLWTHADSIVDAYRARQLFKIVASRTKAGEPERGFPFSFPVRR